MIVIHSIFSLLLSGLYLVVVLYFIIGWQSIKKIKPIINGLSTKVTILIAARDEEERIHYTIEDILAQDYPKHLTEIIIVDDHSTDRTSEIILSYADRGVKLLQLKEDKPLNSYKKKAIEKAIGQSNGDLMVATDADCRMGKQWLSTIVSYYETEQVVMLSAPVVYFEEKTVFERMQTLEFSFLIGIGASFIGNKQAATCNGANLAYSKETFYAVGGFKGIDDLASGDDELLLQKVAEHYPGEIGFVKERKAIVYTHAKHTLYSFIQQRRRWASKSTKYKNKKVIALAICMWLYNLTLLINGCMSFYDIYFFKLFAVQFILKTILEIIFLIPMLSFFKRVALLALLPILSPLHVMYLVYIGLRGNTGKYNWKGRTVK